MLGADSAPAEGGPAVTVTAVLSSPAGPDGVAVTLTTGGTATVDDDYTLSSGHRQHRGRRDGRRVHRHHHR